MGSFTDVVSGTVMTATSVNQLVNVFNGTTVGALAVYGGTSNGNVPWTLQLPSGVAAGSAWWTGAVTGDSYPRVSCYVNAGGYAGVAGGAGAAAATAHLEGSSSGWNFLEGAFFSNGTTVAGAASFGGLTANTLSVSGTIGPTGAVQTVNVDAANLASGGQWNAGSLGANLQASDSGTSVVLRTQRTTANVGRGLTIAATDAGGAQHWGFSVIHNGTGNMNALARVAFNKYVSGTGSTLRALTKGSLNVSGSSATVSHGVSGTPTTVLACTGNTTTSDSWTGCSASAYGSSTFTINLSASNFNCYWVAYQT